jgi:catechol 2,3-dioxygenase-like lactoylglutathione lyase family enzyme
MPLHMLKSLRLGVPDVAATRAYYREFGLTEGSNAGWLGTRDGGEQLELVHAPFRRLFSMEIGVDDRDDVERIAAQLRSLDLAVNADLDSVSSVEPVTGVQVTARVSPRVLQKPSPPVGYNAPGHPPRAEARAPGILRTGRVAPRRLGHVVLGSTDQMTSQRFFTNGFGFKVSDQVKDAASFMRCSNDHHNVLVHQAPVNFVHHTSWQVDDVDEVGRGATAMLEGHPERHVWGLGRHFIGSNFFWYLRDPSGTFSEYYSDLDCVVDDELWDARIWEEDKGLYSWGPPPPPSFVHPEDLAAHMTGASRAT